MEKKTPGSRPRAEGRGGWGQAEGSNSEEAGKAASKGVIKAQER